MIGKYSNEMQSKVMLIAAVLVTVGFIAASYFGFLSWWWAFIWAPILVVPAIQGLTDARLARIDIDGLLAAEFNPDGIEVRIFASADKKMWVIERGSFRVVAKSLPELMRYAANELETRDGIARLFSHASAVEGTSFDGGHSE